MSTYITRVKNPDTGQFTDALMIDDYFGRHRYGLQFAKTNTVLDVDNLKYELEFDEEPPQTPFSKFHFFRSNKENYGEHIEQN